MYISIIIWYFVYTNVCLDRQILGVIWCDHPPTTHWEKAMIKIPASSAGVLAGVVGAYPEDWRGGAPKFSALLRGKHVTEKHHGKHKDPWPFQQFRHISVTKASSTGCCGAEVCGSFSGCPVPGVFSCALARGKGQRERFRNKDRIQMPNMDNNFNNRMDSVSIWYSIVTLELCLMFWPCLIVQPTDLTICASSLSVSSRPSQQSEISSRHGWLINKPQPEATMWGPAIVINIHKPLINQSFWSYKPT